MLLAGAVVAPTAAGELTEAKVRTMLSQRGITAGMSETVRTPEGGSIVITITGISIRTVNGVAHVTANVVARDVSSNSASVK